MKKGRLLPGFIAPSFTDKLISPGNLAYHADKAEAGHSPG